MSHGGCCNCFICKLGKSFGLVESCGDNCCKVKTKKKTKKSKPKTKKK